MRATIIICLLAIAGFTGYLAIAHLHEQQVAAENASIARLQAMYACARYVDSLHLSGAADTAMRDRCG